ncbi:PhzF family phenazine biosynthesis protein [Novosphingopyxis sp.]|uniref:PhzF family phenazine biosynthesis protein n=1 Tax=Novosphingopyxis sp. TaxID=2709690 RepID=UPI003B5AC781
MPTVPYYHVDAFADRPFTGNQAAVMLLESWPEDAVLQGIAAENMFAETAFLLPGEDDADYELRWFAPQVEIALCGHATLASGHVVLSALLPDRDSARFATRRAGLLEVTRGGNRYALSLPAYRAEPAPFDAAVALLGAAPEEVARHPGGYDVFRYAGADQVRALDPDLRGLAGLGDMLFICTAPGEETDVISRVFVPGAGIDEDPVTGAAHAVLTPFWCDRLGREEFTAFQASARGGHLTCRRAGDRAVLGGSCVTVVEGTFRF